MTLILEAKLGGEKAMSGSLGRNGSTRAGGLRSLARALKPLAKELLGKRGAVEGGLIAEWGSIVGPELAARCLPLRMSFPDRRARLEGTLTLQVANFAWATQLQHMSPQLLERINGWFGYSAVARLAFEQGNFEAPRQAEARPQAPAQVTAPLCSEVEQALGQVRDEGLRDALRRFGMTVAADSGSQEGK